MQKRFRTAILIAGLFASAISLAAQSAPAPADAPQLGALSKAALAKPHPKPAFDITGTWQHMGGQSNPWQFTPPASIKLTPRAQAEFDANAKARKAGKVYKDEIGQCWPAGLPIIMTRVWPIAMIQNPTTIWMVSGFMNSVRIIYLDGRPHTDPDLVVRSFDGESIGHWENGDTLVVDTTGFVDEHHWIDAGIPASDALHIVERIKLINNANTMQIEYTFTDPKMWEGSFKSTKLFRRMEDTDITEASCLPDLNAHLPSTHSDVNVR